MDSSPFIVPDLKAEAPKLRAKEPVKQEAESSEDETIAERIKRITKKKAVSSQILSVPDSSSQLLPVPLQYKPRKMIYDEQEL